MTGYTPKLIPSLPSYFCSMVKTVKRIDANSVLREAEKPNLIALFGSTYCTHTVPNEGIKTFITLPIHSLKLQIITQKLTNDKIYRIIVYLQNTENKLVSFFY